MYGRSYKGEVLKNLNGQVSFNQLNNLPNQRDIYKNVNILKYSYIYLYLLIYNYISLFP